MADYPASARERASKQITFWQAAHIARVSPRHLRRLYERYRRHGFDGLYDRRKGRPSPRRVPWAVAEQVLCLYREVYFDFSVRHFQEKLREKHGNRSILMRGVRVCVATVLPWAKCSEFHDAFVCPAKLWT
jgi:Helix-turn-helix domain